MILRRRDGILLQVDSEHGGAMDDVAWDEVRQRVERELDGMNRAELAKRFSPPPERRPLTVEEAEKELRERGGWDNLDPPCSSDNCPHRKRLVCQAALDARA